ncbi:MAG: YceI family protein [Candidatus Dadabacteria bacterium]
MKKRNTNQTLRLLMAAAFALVLSVPVLAQNVKKTASYNITLKGTTTLHNFTMNAQRAGIDVNFHMNPGVSYLAGIPSLTFTLPVKSLKSKESMMDAKAYKILNADKYPELKFQLLSVNVANVQQNKSQVNVTGLLTISGVTRQLNMVTTTITNPDGTIMINGSKVIRMSEYGIKPPTFLLGAMKVGDELTIDYNVRVN